MTFSITKSGIKPADSDCENKIKYKQIGIISHNT